MMAANAVMTFVDFAERLHEARDNGGLPRFKTNTPADMYVSPWYSFEKIVVKELADSMRSTERRDDVSASILNKIKDAVALMSIDSMYDVVFKKLYRGMKKTVVIATDPYIASYISENLIQSNNGAVTQNRFPLTFDTDAAVTCAKNGDLAGERYILGRDKFQVEVLNNLDKLPPIGAIIFIAAPRISDANGLPVRVWAIV